MLQLGYAPVFCAVTADQRGQLLNTNADTIASSIAVSLSAKAETDLRFCFEYKGVLEDLDSCKVIRTINMESYQSLIDQEILHGGILPKVQNAITAINNGVDKVSICGISNLIELNNSTTIL